MAPSLEVAFQDQKSSSVSWWECQTKGVKSDWNAAHVGLIQHQDIF